MILYGSHFSSIYPSASQPFALHASVCEALDSNKQLVKNRVADRDGFIHCDYIIPPLHCLQVVPQKDYEFDVWTKEAVLLVYIRTRVNQTQRQYLTLHLVHFWRNCVSFLLPNHYSREAEIQHTKVNSPVECLFVLQFDRSEESVVSSSEVIRTGWALHEGSMFCFLHLLWSTI